MARIERFEDIEAWKMARGFAKSIYAVSNQGRFSKDYALRDQIRRAAISIMSNIAEGFERGGDQEFLQHLAIAKASCGETRSQLYMAADQDYLTAAEFNQLSRDAESISRLIAGLMSYLKASPFRGNKYAPPKP